MESSSSSSSSILPTAANSKSAATAATSAPTLELNDINMMMNIVGKGFSNGLFSAEEAIHVVELYKKLKRILVSVQ
jgi:hypothetical protein